MCEKDRTVFCYSSKDTLEVWNTVLKYRDTLIEQSDVF